MKRLRWGALATALVTALVPIQMSASAASAMDQRLPNRVNLPDGWQPEGITTDGTSLFVGSLRNGAIFRANPVTGKRQVLAKGRSGRVTAGVDFDRRRDLLWAVGGPTGQVRAHDADTGKLLATYSFPPPSADTSRFLNDVVATPRAVYVTDSFNQELIVIPLRHGRHLPPASAGRTMPLTGDVEFVEGFNLNGIVKFKGMLLAIQSNTGLLFRISPATGRTDQVNLRGEELLSGDGLELDGDILYVVRNPGLVSVVDLNRTGGRGRVVDELTAKSFDTPTTGALLKGSLWVVNARFGTPPTPRTNYWVTRVNAFDD